MNLMGHLAQFLLLGSGDQENHYMWLLAGIVVFIQFLPYLAILFSRRIGNKFIWLALFVSITLLSWGVTFSLDWIKSDFIATAMLLFPNYFLYAIAASYASKASQ